MSTYKIARSFILPLTVLVLVPYSIHTWLTPLTFSNGGSIALGFVFILMGTSFLAWTTALFAAYGNGTLAPWDPTEKLVLLGPYRYVRNPMIIAVIMTIIGESLLFASLHLFAWAAIFWLIYHLWCVLWEEPQLELKYGRPYLYYREHVPRWVPLFKPFEYRP